MIYYNNLFFRTGSLDINNFDFLKGFDTLYDLSTDLLNEIINTLQAAEEQNEMIEMSLENLSYQKKKVLKRSKKLRCHKESKK